MKAKLLAALVAVSAIAPIQTVSAACDTACTRWRTQTQFCSSCCRVCTNQKGEIIYNECDTACVSY